jgi:hypothetical protein
MDLEEKLGIHSTFFIVPERYHVSMDLLSEIKQRGFGLGVHGLNHDGKLFLSYNSFLEKAKKINEYLLEWDVMGFSAPSMIRRHEWMHHLNIKYSTSTFDTDPFEPQPESANTIFPFFVCDKSNNKSFLELPYTLPQDFLLFILMNEKKIDIWKSKLDWIAGQKGMVLLNAHPDYMNFSYSRKNRLEEYPVRFYSEFISYLHQKYPGQFWNPLSQELADYLSKDVS